MKKIFILLFLCLLTVGSAQAKLGLNLGLGLATGGAASSFDRYVATSNGNLPPYTKASATTNSISYRKRRVVSEYSGGRNFQFTYSNWYAIPSGEIDGGLDDLRVVATIEHEGVFYPVTFNGASSVDIETFTNVVSDPVEGLVMDAGDVFYEGVFTEFPNGGDRLLSMSSVAYRGEGILSSASGVNFTLEGAVGSGAVLTPVVSGGVITSVTVTDGGSGYGSGTNVYAYQENDDGTVKQQNIGFSNISSGSISSITITSGGTGWIDGSVDVVAAGGTTNFGSTTLIYCASLITYEPDDKSAPSILLIGDSNARGQSSADSEGDINGNFGFLERSIMGRFGIGSLSISGQSAIGFNQANTNQVDIYDDVKITDLILQLGGNDIGAGRTAAQVKASLDANKANFTYDRLAYVTIKPRTTSTDGFVTVGNQTPVSGFEDGGHRDTHNDNIRDGSYVSDWYVDPDLEARDTVTNDAWRATDYEGNALRYTGDGIHYGGTDAIGIVTVAKNIRGAFTHLEGIGGSITSIPNLNILMGIEPSIDGSSNIITFPTDGQSQSSYDFGLGDLAGSNEPTLVSASGGEPAHYLFDGTEFLQMINSTPFIDRMARTDYGTPFWVAVFGDFNVRSAVEHGIFTTANTYDSAQRGLSLSIGNGFSFNRQRGDTNSTLSSLNISSGIGSGFFPSAYILTKNGSTDSVVFNDNSVSGTWTYNTSVTTRTNSVNPLIGARTTGAGRFPDGTKVYGYYIGRGDLTAAQKSSIKSAAASYYGKTF